MIRSFATRGRVTARAVPRTRIVGDLVREAGSAMVQRPSRLVLTALGVAVGIGSLVATVGLASTAAAQIGSEFNVLLATEVGVGGANGSAQFPQDASRQVDALPGVRSSGVWYVADLNAEVAMSRPALVYSPVSARLVAGSGDYLRADQATVAGQALGGPFARLGASVADLGLGLARQFHISARDLPATLFVDGRQVTVVGIVTRAPVDPALLASVVIPERTAIEWGPAGSTQQTMVILTDPGAAQVVASEAPRTIEPNGPGTLTAVAPPAPAVLRNQVQGSVSTLFLGLAAVALIVGGIGIANMTLVSVLERTSEIGLRRAVGAKRWHVVSQFMLESGITGFAGGVGGACAGILVVVFVSVSKTWTLTLPAGLPLGAPVLGLVVGLVSGSYPAFRAGSVQPVEALRR